jgi:NADH:ubiquinone oxidoreductase subunit D
MAIQVLQMDNKELKLWTQYVRVCVCLYIYIYIYIRVEGIGIVSTEEAINWGLSGPMLQASRVQWELRRADHYTHI